MTEPFVGRTDILGGLIHRLRTTGQRRHVCVVSGMPGIGKSRLLERLAEEGRRQQPDLLPVVLHVHMGAYVPLQPLALPDPTRALLENFWQYRALLTSMFDQLPPTHDDQFRVALERQTDVVREVKVQVNKRMYSLGAVRDASAQSDDIDVGLASLVQVRVGDARPSLGRAFLQSLTPFGTARRPLLLLADEFEKVAGHHVGTWFLELVHQLHHAVVVLASTSSGEGLPNHDEEVRLPSLTLPEIQQYVDLRLVQPPAPEGFADAVFRFSEGHPGAVSIAVGWAVGRVQANARPSPAMFRGLSGDPGKRMNDLIDRIIADVRDEDLERVMHNAWVLRRFDASALRYLATVDAISPLEDPAADRRFLDLLSRLETYSFVEVEQRSNGRHPEHGLRPDETVVYRFHQYLRDGRERFLARERDYYERLHDRAAGYYASVLHEWDEERKREERERTGTEPTAYQGWYRYEDRDWQLLKVEWFYHANHVRTDRARIRLDFTRLFLDAFWWWGWYRRFPFCDELLDEWEWNQARDDEPWTQALRAFHDSYPTRWPWVPEESWKVVARSMRTIRREAGLDGPDVATTDPNRRHVRGITALFLAHAARRLRPTVAEAEGLYREALRLFQADPWNTAWATYELGDLLASDPGRAGEVRELVGKALELALEQEDAELAGNACHRLGDEALTRDDVDDAARWYEQALLHGYEFQTSPHPPDDYTRHLYLDIAGQVAGRLLALRREGDGSQAAVVSRRIRAFFAPYWEEVGEDVDHPGLETLLDGNDADALAEALAPPAPSEVDVEQGLRSVYYQQALDVLDAIQSATRRATPA